MKDKIEYPLFTRKGMDRRYNQAREMMADREIDVLLVTGEDNFHYFTGTCASLAFSLFACEAKRPQGCSTLITSCDS